MHQACREWVRDRKIRVTHYCHAGPRARARRAGEEAVRTLWQQKYVVLVDGFLLVHGLVGFILWIIGLPNGWLFYLFLVSFAAEPIAESSRQMTEVPASELDQCETQTQTNNGQLATPNQPNQPNSNTFVNRSVHKSLVFECPKVRFSSFVSVCLQFVVVFLTFSGFCCRKQSKP